MNSIGSGGTVPYTYDIYGPTGSLFASTSNNMGVVFTINPTLSGDYTLVVTDANGCIDSSIVTILPSSTIDEFEKISSNPSKDIFNILFENFSDQYLSISIYDILGKLIYYKNHNNVKSDFKASINLEKYLGSLYLLEIKTKDQIIKKKLIKK